MYSDQFDSNIRKIGERYYQKVRVADAYDPGYEPYTYECTNYMYNESIQATVLHEIGQNSANCGTSFVADAMNTIEEKYREMDRSYFSS